MYDARFQELIKKRKKWIELTKENEFEIDALLTGLYDDPSHFIYEILQNAEDAGAKRVVFNLFDDRLEIYHNGRDFTFEDVEAITSIGKSTKKEDITAIGKFGVGFKSVFAITNTPRIYSGKFSFEIRDFVVPHPVTGDCKDGTKIVLLFNHQTRSPKEVFGLIRMRLKDMGLHTLLFLKNIEKIEWKINEDERGYYSRKTEYIEKYVREVTLLSEVNSEKEEENWLVFERPIIANGKELRVEAAFKIEKNNGNERTIVPVDNAKLAAFFLTDKETHLRFLIQGPYRTTTARDNVPLNEDWNIRLISETAKLVAESISKVKYLGLLNVKFLETLPINLNSLKNPAFKPIYDKVKEKLSSDEKLLPAYGGGYVSAKNALLVVGKDLRELLSSEQLKALFQRSTWLEESITKDRTPELRKYLIEELNIPEIDADKFARAIDEDFIKKQNDEWMKRFYAFLINRKELWERGKYSWERDGVLLSKPIIRLQNGTHACPFGYNGEPLVYLPSENDSINKLFPIVKKNIAEDRDAKEFLKKLGLREPDAFDGIVHKILPEYKKESVSVDWKTNKQHVVWIVKTLNKIQDNERRKRLLEELKHTPFLLARNIVNSQTAYKSPAELYLGETYTGKKDVEIFFEGNSEIWLLDERYTDIVDVATLEEIGCKSEIYVKFRKADWDGNVILSDYPGWHRRGLEGFDPDCEIEGLEHALRHITIEKAKIIWNILKRNQNYKRIFGFIEVSSRADFSNGGRHYQKDGKFSKMGKLLTEYPWLPDKKGNFHKPSEITLFELHDDFDKESLEARTIADKLKFKIDVERKLLEKLPPQKRKRYELVDKLCQVMPEEKAEKLLESLIEKQQREQKDKGQKLTPNEITAQFRGALVTQTSSIERDSCEQQQWTGLTPEEEDQVRNDYAGQLDSRIKEVQIESKPKVTIDSKIADPVDPKEFLLEQYNGHCQICNTRLDLGGDKRPYFEVFRIKEFRGESKWANMEFNVLCLCPNCHALMKHGGYDLSNIWTVAEKISNGDIAPEPVEERGGDFYIVKIKVAGKDRELFYSPVHMNKIAAVIQKIKNS